MKTSAEFQGPHKLSHDSYIRVAYEGHYEFLIVQRTVNHAEPSRRDLRSETTDRDPDCAGMAICCATSLGTLSTDSISLGLC